MAQAAGSAAQCDKLRYLEQVTRFPDEVQRQLLREILAQNSGAEYLRRIGVSGDAPDADEAFRRLAPLTTYEDILPDVTRIANGDRSPILSGKPISEFLTSSGTSGGESKLMPTIEEDMDRRCLLYSFLMPVMNQFVPGLDQGKAMYLFFVKSERSTPGGLPARPVLTSYYKSPQFTHRAHDPFTVHTSPNEAILCSDVHQSMYAQLLCGLLQRTEVLRAGAIFASGFLRAIHFLEKNWVLLCDDIRAGTLNADIVTDPSVRRAVERVQLRADPALATALATEFCKPSWDGIVPRLWPNIRYIEVIVTGAMAQYVPTLNFYGGGLPLCSTMYASSESYFGLNLDPTCDPGDVLYTLLPSMCFYEFLPLRLSSSGEGGATEADLVDLVGVELGQEYELVVTTFAGLYRYRVGDVLRVEAFMHRSPQFRFLRRKNVLLSIDVDKTDECELHAAVSAAAGKLERFGASLLEYTSWADAAAVPAGRYVLYWELLSSAGGMAAVPAASMEDCCIAVEESLNSVYRQCRASGIIGPLQIRLVAGGTFDALMDEALSRGASVNQYKSPRCVSSKTQVELLDGRVLARYVSPRCPKQ
ncbi:probable indole-3-acetic acid-amido synthetase GH3.4 [Lolium rigidum]|uniref:probable indole-3-acetic acid-amido synthetase GH3.4 n=1 Tax=Lolium rigidum TaxID=89674 RepID=UPI001F5D2838|nr:probable indole-3-acetic acid-amido synthetase GH3.4 [Lolium rigidum]